MDKFIKRFQAKICDYHNGNAFISNYDFYYFKHNNDYDIYISYYDFRERGYNLWGNVIHLSIRGKGKMCFIDIACELINDIDFIEFLIEEEISKL